MHPVYTNPSTGLPIGPEVDDSPASPPTRCVLDGQYIQIVPLELEKHGEALFRGTSGKKAGHLWEYLAAGPFSDRETFDAYLGKMAVQDDPLAFAIINRLTRSAVGMTTYLRIEPGHRVIEVGHILFTPALQRSIGATEAMYLMARHAFEVLGYRRYEWKCNALNEPSRRAALRLGFEFEGVFRQHMIVKGRNRDTAWFSMLDSEWPSRKAAFEAWLQPTNFDSNGGQKQSLAAFRSSAPGT
jgi:RimJ/RimL family protein N-acetyltransferase